MNAPHENRTRSSMAEVKHHTTEPHISVALQVYRSIHIWHPCQIWLWSVLPFGLHTHAHTYTPHTQYTQGCCIIQDADELALTGTEQTLWRYWDTKRLIRDWWVCVLEAQCRWSDNVLTTYGGFVAALKSWVQYTTGLTSHLIRNNNEYKWIKFTCCVANKEASSWAYPRNL